MSAISKLARAGKPPTVVTIAIARELAGSVWAIAYQVTVCVKFCKGGHGWLGHAAWRSWVFLCSLRSFILR